MTIHTLPQVYITLKQAAAMLGYQSTRSVQRKVQAGELEARGKGRGRRIVYDSVIRHPEYTQEQR